MLFKKAKEKEQRIPARPIITQTRRYFDEAKPYYMDFINSSHKVCDRIKDSDPELAEDIKEAVRALINLISFVAPMCQILEDNQDNLGDKEK